MAPIATQLDIPECLAQGLFEQGLAVIDQFLPLALVRRLAAESDQLLADGQMRPARVGRGEAQRLDPKVRGDLISWFQPAQLSPAQAELMAVIELTRLALNRRLFLGLFDYEACHARYPSGTHYRRHRDRFSKSGRRIMTLVTYLNEGWQPGDGGELRIFQPDQKERVIEPIAGRAVAFFSDRFPHEVLKAAAPRKSVAGWFRSRP